MLFRGIFGLVLRGIIGFVAFFFIGFIIAVIWSIVMTIAGSREAWDPWNLITAFGALGGLICGFGPFIYDMRQEIRAGQRQAERERIQRDADVQERAYLERRDREQWKQQTKSIIENLFGGSTNKMSSKLFEMHRIITENAHDKTKSQFIKQQFLNRTAQIEAMTYDELEKRNFSSAVVGFKVLILVAPKDKYKTALRLLETPSNIENSLIRMGLSSDSSLLQELRNSTGKHYGTK